MGLEHLLGKKKKSEHSIIEAQRESPQVVNNSKNSLFCLKITVLLDLAWSKMGEQQFTASSYLNLER